MFRTVILMMCLFVHVPAIESAGIKEVKTIHFFGDSISRGWGFGKFDHESFINSIQGIANKIAVENGCEYGFVRSEMGQNFESVWLQKRKKNIKPGDYVLFEDAGHHYNNIDAYRKMVELFIFAAHYTPPSKKIENIEVLLATTADYNPPEAYYNSEYDSPVNEKGDTINGIFRNLSLRKGVTLLDWNRLMDEAVKKMKQYGVSPMHRDGVHPNIFGNFLYAVSLAELAGLKVQKYESVTDEFLKYRKDFKKAFRFSMRETQLRSILKDLIEIVQKNRK